MERQEGREGRVERARGGKGKSSACIRNPAGVTQCALFRRKDVNTHSHFLHFRGFCNPKQQMNCADMKDLQILKDNKCTVLIVF